jgi:enoyl-CoA hydratase/carnithine racemase
MDYSSILYDVEEGVATITLNKPERLNAFDNDMLVEWADALQRADRDRDVRAIIITGAGRGFCSGMNVAQEAAGDGVLRTQATVATRRHSLRDRVHHTPHAHPAREAVHRRHQRRRRQRGYGHGHHGRHRFASSTARVGMTYVRMGLIPGDGGCYSLPRVVGAAGPRHDLDGKDVHGPEALEMGYVMPFTSLTS